MPGFWALTVAPALRSPGRLSLPLGSRRGLNQQESVGGEAGHSLLTSFPYKCGSLVRRPSVRGGVRESLADLLRQSLPAKGGNEGCLSGRLVRPRRASTAFYIGPGNALPLEHGTICPTHRHLPGRQYWTRRRLLQSLELSVFLYRVSIYTTASHSRTLF